MLYALKSELPNNGCNGAPVGPAPMSEALKEGATRSTADVASSEPLTNLLSQIWTRFCLKGDAVGLANGARRLMAGVAGGGSCPSKVRGPFRVTFTVSWYCPAAIRMVAAPSSGLRMRGNDRECSWTENIRRHTVKERHLGLCGSARSCRLYWRTRIWSLLGSLGEAIPMRVSAIDRRGTEVTGREL